MEVDKETEEKIYDYCIDNKCSIADAIEAFISETKKELTELKKQYKVKKKELKQIRKKNDS